MTKDNDLITMGMNLGIYTFSKFFTEGAVPNAKAFAIMRDHCAKQLEDQTGMPAEDLATSVQPVIDEMMGKIL